MKLPITSQTPKFIHKDEPPILFDDFIRLLIEEEAYFEEEKHNTKLMITRLRKIFYDEWGWDYALIRNAASIEGRYAIQVWQPDENESIQENEHFFIPKNKKTVRYRTTDKVYGSTRIQETPLIYELGHREILFPDGYYVDISHVLAGLDAHNNPNVVTPLPSSLIWGYPIFPYVHSNKDIVTWMGDIASVSADFLLAQHHYQRPLSDSEKQYYIDLHASASDMLADIDAYVIASLYKVSDSAGLKVSDIFLDYYTQEGRAKYYREKRFSIFAKQVGLVWNGKIFENKKKWLAYYKIQLRNNITFQLFSLVKHTFANLKLLVEVWYGQCDAALEIENLLLIFLDALQEAIQKEPHYDFEFQSISATPSFKNIDF